MRFWAKQRVVARAVVLARHPEHRRVGELLIGEVGGDLAVVADERDEPDHRRPGAAPLIGVAHVADGGKRRVAIRQDAGGRRLVGDQEADVLGMAGDEGQRVDGAATAREEVDRSAAERFDHARGGRRAWSSGVDCAVSSAFVLRSTPRGS